MGAFFVLNEHRINRFFGIVFLVSALLLLGGCGDSKSTAKAAEPIAACTLMTKADVEAVYHLPVADPTHTETGEVPTESSSTGYVSTCNYHTEGDPFKQAGVLARQSFSAENAISAYNGGAKETKGAGNSIEDIAGLGDAANWDGTYEQLSVVKGAIWLIINVDATETATARDVATGMAQTILGRLP